MLLHNYALNSTTKVASNIDVLEEDARGVHQRPYFQSEWHTETTQDHSRTRHCRASAASNMRDRVTEDLFENGLYRMGKCPTDFTML